MDTLTRQPLTEKQQKRIAWLQSLAYTPEQAQQRRRYLRPLLFLFLFGVVFVAGGVLSYTTEEQQFRPDSWGYAHLGNHGTGILMGLLGLAMIAGGVLLIRKMNRGTAALRSS